MARSKRNPDSTLIWLVAGAAGAYVVYTMFLKKPAEGVTSEAEAAPSTTPQVGTSFQDTGVPMTDLIPQVDLAPSGAGAPGGAAAPGETPSVAVPVESAPVAPPPPAVSSGGGGRNIPPFRPSAQSIPAGGVSAGTSANWVKTAGLYVPDTLLALVREVRKAQKTKGQMTSLALGLQIPKPDAFATFVTRAVKQSSADRKRAADVLSALLISERDASERAQIDSRLRTLAAAELIALSSQEPRPDISKMVYLYDRDNKSLKYDPAKLARQGSGSGTSKPRPGQSAAATPSLTFSLSR